MNLEPNDLLLFVRVVEEGSFSRAAQRLAVPVSTVSRRITALETALGERLLLRTTRKLTVTDLGNALLEHARQVVEGVESAAALGANRQIRPKGRLRVSMLADMGNLAPFLAEFVLTYPEIVLELDLSTRFVDLIAENFDLALRTGELRDDATLAARRIVVLTGGLYASPGYLKRRGTPREPEELLDHRALAGVMRGGEPLQWVLERGKTRWQGAPPARAIANSPDVLMRMATHGAGITLAEQRFAEAYVKSGQLVRVLPEWRVPPVPLSAVFPGHRLMPARTRVFIDALVAKFASSEPNG